MIEALLSFFECSPLNSSKKLSRNILRTGVFIVDVLLLSFFIAFSASKVPKSELNVISKSLVQNVLLICIIGTAFVILIQAWARRDFEDEVQENLATFDRVFNKRQKSKISTKPLSVIARLVVNIIFLFICLALSSVPITIDKIHGMWEILLYPILFIKLTSFRYVLSVTKLGERFRMMRKELQEMVENEDKLEMSGKNFRVFKDSQKQKLEFEENFAELSKSYNFLTSAVSCFNSRFDLSILSVISSAFLSITYCGYNFFIEIETRMSGNVIIGEMKLEPHSGLTFGSLCVFREP